ncbi:MAG TPA: response regulator transcription factor [Gemmatimonadales bacterium]|nr:response regulator transcription factor [Gemmatimonadales bacterium]
MSTLHVLIRAQTPRAFDNNRTLLDGAPGVVVVSDGEARDVTLVDLTDGGPGPGLSPPGTGPVLYLVDGAATAGDFAKVRGASYVTDGVSREQLVAALRAVASGLTVREPSAGERSSAPARLSAPVSADPALTEREREILRLLGEGLGNREMAQLLALSDHTVKFHLRSIFTKLGARSRTEAVSLAVRRGLLML